MTRPTYESDDDRKREQAVIEKVATSWGVDVVKLKPFYRFDFAFLDPDKEIIGFGEVKVVTYPKSKWPHYMISAEKVWEADRMLKTDNLTVHLFVQWTDCLGYHVIRDLSRYELKVGGRTDRNDPQDVEPCYFIPIRLFSEIK